MDGKKYEGYVKNKEKQGLADILKGLTAEQLADVLSVEELEKHLETIGNALRLLAERDTIRLLGDRAAKMLEKENCTKRD